LRALIRFAAVLVVAPCLSCVRWQEVRPTGAGFAVEMPDPDVCTCSSQQVGFRGLPRWECHARDWTAYSKRWGFYTVLSYQFPPNQDLGEAESWFRAVQAKGAQRTSMAVVESDKRLIEGITWLRTVSEKTDSTGLSRSVELLLIRPEGAFRLVVHASTDSWPTKAEDRFVHSFQFAGPPGGCQ
jgi:hypothetical protein